MIFELHNNIVSITKEGMSLPEFKRLYEQDATEDKSLFSRIAEYIYFVYSKDSVYKEVLPEYRKQLVCKDRLKTKQTEWKEMEKSVGVNVAIEKYKLMELTAKERLLEEVKEKIEDYIDFWKTTKIDTKNHELVASTLKNASDLLNMLEKVEKRISNDNDSKTVGGGKATLFED